MIKIIYGNLFESKAEALVNTVNCVGVMGKGIALQFKILFPNNFRAYKEACNKGEVKVGKMFIYEDSNIFINKKLIINFPTKTHWKYPSQYSFIKDGLVSLKSEIISRNIKSIAIPAIGCNNGGLDYNIVKEMIMKELGDLDCEIYLYEPFNDKKTE